MGLTQEELQGEGWQRMLHPDDRERVLKAWRESVANGTPYEQEERHRGADGQYRWFLARGVPLRDPDGRIVRWYGTNTDIEDRKQAEWALQEAQAGLSHPRGQPTSRCNRYQCQFLFTPARECDSELRQSTRGNFGNRE